MFDAKKLFDQVMGGQGLGQTLGGSGNAAGGSLGGMAQQVLGQLGGGGRPGQGGGLATGALAGGAIGLLLGNKKARKTAMKLGGSAVQIGGLALVAGLAYKAWSNYQQQQGAPATAPAGAPTATGQGGPLLLPPPAESPFNVEAAPEGPNARAEHLLVAMISAAKADGHIDAEEQRQIFQHLDALQLDTEAKAFVMDELRAPLDLERVVRFATDPSAAAEIYTASLLAMDPDTPAERAYLDLLAARIGLDKALAAEIERSAAELAAV